MVMDTEAAEKADEPVTKMTSGDDLRSLRCYRPRLKEKTRNQFSPEMAAGSAYIGPLGR